MVGINSDADIQHNAFAKGIREIDQRNNRVESINVRREIRYQLGGRTPFRLHGIPVKGLSRTQYCTRQDGEIAHTPAERDALIKIFREHGVKSPWGL